MDFASIARTFAEIHHGEVERLSIDSVEIEDDFGVVTAYVEVSARFARQCDKVLFSTTKEVRGG